jgi:integrase
MPICTKCNKNIHPFSLRSYSRTIGRCNYCDREVQQAVILFIDTFGSRFRRTSYRRRMGRVKAHSRTSKFPAQRGPLLRAPGRGRFTTPEEMLKFFDKCDEEQDTELKVFVILAATTGLRKGSILPRKYADVFLDE